MPAPSPPRGRRRWRRAARALGAVALGCELLWLLAANTLLLTPAGERWLAAPERRVRLTWERGWSLFPGDLHLRGFRLEQRLARGRFLLTADATRGRLALRPLLRRELRFVGVRAVGVELRRLGARERPTPPPSPRRAASRRWALALPAVELTELRRVEIGALELRGRGRARGALELLPGARFDLRLDEVRLDDGGMWLAGGPVGGKMTLIGRARLGPYPPPSARGLAALAFLAGELEVVPGGRLVVRRGHLVAPSELHLPLAQPPVRLPRLGAEPEVREVHLVVRRSAEGPRLHLGVSAERLRMAVGEGTLESGPFSLRGSSADTALATLLAARSSLATLPAAAALESLALRGVRMGPLRLDLDLDEVSAEVDVLGLLRHQLRVGALRGAGLSLAVGAAASPPPRASGARAWSLELADARLAGVRSVEVEGITANGEGELAVSLSLDPEEGLLVSRCVTALRGGRLEGAGLFAERIVLDVDAALARAPVDAGARALLAALSARVALGGRVSRLDFLRRVGAARSWVALDGEGDLDLAIELAAGRLGPGSRVTVDAEALRVTGLGYQASGGGRVTGVVEKGEMRLAVSGRRLRAWPGTAGAGTPHLVVDRLEVELASRDLELDAVPQDLRAHLRLHATAPALQRFSPLLPAAAGLELAGGRGTVQADLRADAARNVASGWLQVAGDQVAVTLPGLALAGAADLRLELASRDLRAGRFAIAGSRLELREVSWRERGAEASAGGAWWARADVRDGSLAWATPLTAAGDLDFVMRDSGPLVSLIARRRQLPAWVERALAVRDVRGQARLALQRETVRIESLQARGGPLELLARLRLAAHGRRGALYLGLGPLGLGVALEGDRRDLKLLRPRAWYDALGPLD